MEKYLYLFSVVVIVVAAFAKLRSDLHYAQLNSYRNSRYGNWLKKNFFTPGRWLELLSIILVGMLMTWGLNTLAFLMTVIYLGIIAYTLFTKKQKKKLVFTKRATRLFGVASVLFLMFLAMSLMWNGYTLFSFILFVLFLSPLLIIAANVILIPVENYINNWYYRDAQRILNEHHGLKIIGITGSFGKTSTKHFLQRILAEKYNTLMTPGSYNTTMGVIRTIREYLKPIHEIFIVEMGAKQRGDIKEICDLVHPQTGILTAVAEQHLESFKTLENVKKTKFELIEALPATGFAVLNADYDLIFDERNNIRCPTAFYGVENIQAEYSVTNITYSAKGMQFKILRDAAEILSLETKLMGEYNASNILAACILALHYEVPVRSIEYAVKRLEPVQHRLEIRKNPGGVTVIDDAFNANPKGAAMALEVLDKIQGNKKIIVTPGMIELGDKESVLNEQFGGQIADVCDYVILVGEKQTQPILKGLNGKEFPEDKRYVAQNFNDAVAHLNGIVKAGDVVLYENDLPDTYER